MTIDVAVVVVVVVVAVVVVVVAFLSSFVVVNRDRWEETAATKFLSHQLTS